MVVSKKFLTAFLLAITFMVGPAMAKKKDQEGVLFFSTAGGWSRGGVLINNEWAGWIHQGYVMITLPVGEHTLTGFRSRSDRYVTTFPLEMDFEIKPGQITSLGAIVFINKNYKESYLFNLKNNYAAKKYIGQYYRGNTSTLLEREIITPVYRYQNKELDKIRASLIINDKYNYIPVNGFVTGDIGILVDARNPKEPKIVETDTLERLTKFSSVGSLGKFVFMNALSELFLMEEGNFKPIGNDRENLPVLGAQSESWLITVGRTGDLSLSKDYGKSWKYIETEISSEPVLLVLDVAGDNVIVGPVTTNKGNNYKKRTGYIVNAKTAEVSKIKWSKYVTEKSNFFEVKGALFLDPVTLGNKAFLFKFDNKKWREIRLPNRHCIIRDGIGNIFLDCKRGDNFISRDAGLTWEKVNAPVT